MSGTEDKLCRFCLSRICGRKWEPVEEITREIIVVLQFQLNLDITQSPVICDICTTNFRTAFNFKSECLEIEDELFPFIINEKKDLIEAYLKLKSTKNGDIHIESEQMVCRLCLTPTSRSSALWPSRNQNPELMDVLKKYFSQMALDHFDQPGICPSCTSSLNHFLKFLTAIQNIEGQIEQYIKSYGTDDLGHIDLSDVQRNNGYPIKKEQDITYIDECDTSSQDDTNLTDSENTELNIKIEEHDLEEEIHIIKEEIGTNNSKLGNESSRRKAKSTKVRKIYKCKICPYRNPVKSRLDRHLIVHKTPSEIQMYSCDKCDFKTKHEWNLERHALQHVDRSTRELFRCESCPFRTGRESHYNKHLRYHDDPSAVKVFTCKSCEFETFYKNSYNHHTLSHKEESQVELFKCDLCDYQSRHRNAMVQHTLTHRKPVESKMFACEHCQYKARTKSRLNKHLYTHKPKSEVEMYRCSTCSYESRHRYVVKKHELVHKKASEVVMYECDRCTYQSRFSNALRVHKKIHDKK